MKIVNLSDMDDLKSCMILLVSALVEQGVIRNGDDKRALMDRVAKFAKELNRQKEENE